MIQSVAMTGHTNHTVDARHSREVQEAVGEGDEGGAGEGEGERLEGHALMEFIHAPGSSARMPRL